jgi:hypothetical protein
LLESISIYVSDPASHSALIHMKPQHPRAIPQTPQRQLTANVIHLHQIDAEITRLTKQLEYLQRVRQQYAHLIDTEEKGSN